ncbi:AraC family transcriptional regulator [Pyxidicoccus parkwayensis]|uniref:AraC family transcriptional regulator n=2 Tax=Pyxidicoccus parkwayensis TaxID=2813578 RepID=A0ABX7PC09_9BACT|nr:AraC family transcriptional regulator [Pyxidicoccus parkwaysis]
MLSRAPCPPLQPLVRMLWASEGAEASTEGGLERVLPTGAMHLVFRLSDSPLRLLEGGRPQSVGRTVVGGARASYYVREVSQPVSSVGIQFHAGAAPLLLGVPAHTLAERHTALEDVWGPVVAEMRERLRAEHSPHARLALMEQWLLARLRQTRGALHPAVELALQRFAAGDGVKDVVDATGYSHRRFIVLFREAVGLPPKTYTRVLRFQDALARLARCPDQSWSDLALDAGYADQPHLHRDFIEFTGLSPGRYRALRPGNPNHVPIPSGGPVGRSKTFKT